MPKRIAIVTPTYPPYRGGIGKVAAEDAAQLRAAGFEVDVYVPAKDASEGVLPLREFGRYGKAAFVPGAAMIPRKYDLTFLHYPFFGGAEPLACAKRLFGGTLAVVYHMDVVGKGALGAFFRAHKAICMPGVLRAADRIIVTSEDYAANGDITKVFAARHYDFRALPPSVDTDRFAPGPRPDALLARYGIGADEPVVLMVGGLDPAHYFKGVPALIKAMRTDALHAVRAVVVGDGSLRPGFEDDAKRSGVADRFIWAGNVSEEELPSHYRLADVFAFPSTDRSEAFGIAALEALSTGVPVVASDLAGVRTIVRNGETGRLVPPGSVSALALRLSELLEAPDTRARMGRMARQMAVEAYGDRVRAGRLEAIVRELL